MLNIPIAAALVLSAVCGIFAWRFLLACRTGERRAALLLKGAAGLCFVAVGLIMALLTGGGFAWKVLAGLLLGLVGDELLALRFIVTERETEYFSAGAAAFAIGHAFYIWALAGLGAAQPAKAAAIAAAALALAALYARKNRADAGGLRVPAAIYIALVTVMGSMACAAAWDGFSAGTLLFALGGMGFVISDNILISFTFGRDSRFFLNVLLHGSYYAAQLCIAWSILFIR